MQTFIPERLCEQKQTWVSAGDDTGAKHILRLGHIGKNDPVKREMLTVKEREGRSVCQVDKGAATQCTPWRRGCGRDGAGLPRGR